MGRDNKIIKSVFSGIIATDDISKFLNTDVAQGIQLTPELKEMKELYHEILSPMMGYIKDLAKLEEVIIQLRSRECIDEEIKITLQREYIYARSTFYRNDRETKDIRAIIGKTDVYGTDVDLILLNEPFMKKAKKALYDVMTGEIEKNIKNLKLQEA
jgi:hypothetical protein